MGDECKASKHNRSLNMKKGKVSAFVKRNSEWLLDGELPTVREQWSRKCLKERVRSRGVQLNYI